MKIIWLTLSFLIVAGCTSKPVEINSNPMTSIEWVSEDAADRSPANVTPDDLQLYNTSIGRAAVWFQPDMNRFDILRSDYREADGPFYALNENLDCVLDAAVTAEKKKTSGKTAKFWCYLSGQDKVSKIKYFPQRPSENREVFAAIVTTRLFRALGFMANRNYSVTVNCPNCTEHPWGDVGKKDAKPRTTPFTPALIEFKPKGKDIKGQKEGWPWRDLDVIDTSLPSNVQETMRTHRGALKLLSIFVQHSDNKPEQQNIICLDKIKKTDGKSTCDRPLMYIHDLGATLGGGGIFTSSSAKMHFGGFADTCMWKDEKKNPRPNLKSSMAGSFDGKQIDSIEENSRLFLVSLMTEFASRPERVRSLFEVAQISKMHELSNEKITTDHWVSAFNIKVNELKNKTCYKDQRKQLKEAAKKGLPYTVNLL